MFVHALTVTKLTKDQPMTFTTKQFAAVFLLGLMTSMSQAQIDIDLSVDITESEGIYTYVYTLENSDFSFQAVDVFFLTTGKNAEILEISGPDDNWFAEYDPGNEARANLQAAFITGLSEDGTKCNVSEEFAIAPGSSKQFTIRSTWKPEPKLSVIGKLTPDCLFDGPQLERQIDSPSIPGEPIVFEACDFDEDGKCDTNDINNLGRAIFIGDNEVKFDITKDGLVNIDDLNGFLTETNRFNGDADFNGKVEFADFLILSGTFGNADLDWTDGDFDADGMVAFGDFLILSGNFGKGEVAAAAVPEPTAQSLAVFAMVCIAMLRRRRK